MNKQNLSVRASVGSVEVSIWGKYQFQSVSMTPEQALQIAKALRNMARQCTVHSEADVVG